MDIGTLETVFLFFYDNRTEYHYFGKIKEKITGIKLTDLELQAVIQKLVKDGYLIEEEHIKTKNVTPLFGKGTIHEQHKSWGWFISYDGIFLIDTLPNDFTRKPYIYLNKIEKKKKRREFIEGWPKRNWWLVSIVTLFVGWFSDIGKESFLRILSPSTTQSTQATPALTDTVQNHIQEIDSIPKKKN